MAEQELKGVRAKIEEKIRVKIISAENKWSGGAFRSIRVGKLGRVKSG
jgi:hypothetical protein